MEQDGGKIFPKIYNRQYSGLIGICYILTKPDVGRNVQMHKGMDTMSIMSKIMKQREDAAKLYESKGGAKITQSGDFKVALKTAKVEKNRAGDADTIKLEYKVLEVMDGDPAEVGTTFTEYISSKSSDVMLADKVAILVDQLLRAGVKPEKLEDEEDETVFDAGRTACNVASKFIAKHEDEVVAYVGRRESKKMAENGKPYFNNYWMDPAKYEGEAPKETPKKEAKKDEAPKASKPGKSPYASDDDDD